MVSKSKTPIDLNSACVSLCTSTLMMGEFNDEEDVEQYDVDGCSEEARALKARFSLKDFLSCYETREILEDAFCKKFEEKIEQKLCNFYERVRDDHRKQCTGMLAHDRGGIGCGEFVNIVWDHLEKDYDLEVFYDDPELATPLLNSIDEIKEHEAQLKQSELQERFKQANKAFDWKNKRYV